MFASCTERQVISFPLLSTVRYITHAPTQISPLFSTFLSETIAGDSMSSYSE
nr:MAG TPA: hypothetical protein [Bacteriophage sp.]